MGLQSLEKTWTSVFTHRAIYHHRHHSCGKNCLQLMEKRIDDAVPATGNTVCVFFHLPNEAQILRRHARSKRENIILFFSSSPVAFKNGSRSTNPEWSCQSARPDRQFSVFWVLLTERCWHSPPGLTQYPTVGIKGVIIIVIYWRLTTQSKRRGSLRAFSLNQIL